MTTYLVHMRDPRLLYRQLGAWKFWGFQAHFVIGALSQFVLAPVLWSFWLVPSRGAAPLWPSGAGNRRNHGGGGMLPVS